MQRKFIFHRLLSAFLFLSVLLSGCGRINSPNASLSEDTSTAEPNPATEPSSILPDKELHLCTSGTDKGYYQLETLHPGSVSILYIDYAAAREIFLCPRPECLHDTDSCTSFLSLGEDMAIPILFATDDALYFIQTGASHSAPPHLSTSSLSGTEMRTLAEFPSTYTVLPDFYTDGESIYLQVYDIDADSITSTQKIVKVDLGTGACYELYEFSGQSLASIVGAFGRNLIADIYTVEPGAEKGAWAYRFLNVDTAELSEEVISIDPDKCGSYWYGSSLYKIHYEEKELEITDYCTQESKTVSYADVFTQDGFPEFQTDIGVASMNDALVRLDCKTVEYAENPRFMFLFNLITGELQPYSLIKTFNQDEITILAETDDAYLVCTDYIAAESAPSGLTPFYTYSPQYALISKNDFAASAPNYIRILSDVYPEAWA